MKRCISVLLAAVLCLCCIPYALAADSASDVRGAVMTHPVTDDLIVVITYGSIFSQIGETPDVILKTPEQRDVTLADDCVLSQSYSDNGTSVPQLFIRLPKADNEMYEESVLYVGEGAFLDGSGATKSPAFEQSIYMLDYARWNVYGHSEYRIPDSRLKSTSQNYVLLGQPVSTLLIDVGGADAELWKSVCNFTVNGQPCGAEFVPQQAGEYTVTARLNDFVWDSYTFTALDKAAAHRQGMRSAFVDLLELPKQLGQLMFATLIPGGALTIVAFLFSVPFEAVASIFRTPYNSISFD